MIKSNLSIFLSFTAIFLFSRVSCKKDDPAPSSADPADTTDVPNDTVEVSQSSLFIANINGDAFSSSPLLIAGTTGGSSGLTARVASGTQISNGDTTSVVITITYLSDTSFAAGKVFSGSNGPLGEYCFGFYGLNNGSANEIEAYSTEGGSNNADLTITHIDEANGVWSGSFSFTAVDANSSQVFSVTNGEFENVEY